MRLQPFLIGLGVLGLDQLTKALAMRYLRDTATVAVVPGVFHLTLIYNTGVAFGMLKGYALPVLVATPLILAGLFWMSMDKRRSPDRRAGVCLGLILGGALGNGLDRVRWGAVIDFLDFRVWPVFNLADSCITLGALLMAWNLLRRAEK